MPFYGFKANPKQLVVNKAQALFGRNIKVQVTGKRYKSPLEAKALGIKPGSYYVECFIDGQTVGTASTNNWRKAYGLLVIEVEKAYERKLHAPVPEV